MPGPVLSQIKSSFAGGEFSPALWSRVDINKFLTGLRTARNVTVLPQGGIRNRCGTVNVATAKDSTHPVRVIPFIVSTTTAYVLELGHKYIRFYTAGAQVSAGSPAAWNSGTAYVPGNLVSSGGVNYYCIAANTNQAPPNATFWYALQNAIMEIPTPYLGSDLAALKFAQSADVLYIAHGSYAPQTLTYASSTNWVLAPYAFQNGPFMPENTDTTSTITPSALSGNGITLTAIKNIFFSGQVGALFQLVSTIVGQTITPNLTAAATNWTPTGSTWQATISGTWAGTILVQTSPDNITWTTVSTVTTNSTVSGSTGFTQGYLRAIMQSGLPFSGTASVTLTGNGSTSGPTNLGALNALTGLASCGAQGKITITGTWTGTVALQESDDGGNTWTNIATYTTNQAGTTQATNNNPCLIRAQMTAYTSGTAVVTVDGTTGTAPTKTFNISSASVSAAIQCGSNWAVITTGSWTGKIRVEISTDGGNNWTLVQTFSSASANNFNTSGSTGVSQCLLRVSTDPTTAWSGTATVDLTSTSFDWTGVVQITAVNSATSATANVLSLSPTNNSGLANTSATWQWSEGSWSTFRGWPSCAAFYQDRLAWGGPQPATVNFSQTGNYTNFLVNSPIQASDSLSVLLASRTLNQVQSLVPMPQALLAMTSDSEFGISTGSDGTLGPTSVVQQLFGHRGSAAIDPVVIGNEVILLQQMGTILRNFIFQLAVNGFMGDNISVTSQHLFTGYSIVAMAYQQEPDSIIWMVRNDGVLISLTYSREQEMSAFTRHDTLGSFLSVCTIPNPSFGFNEVWFTVSRTIGGVTSTFIERMPNRDTMNVQGAGLNLTPAQQWFVDCGISYSGAPANTFSGASYLNGQAITILADGNVVANPYNPNLPPVTVSGGSFSLPNGLLASNVIAGLPFVSDIETLELESPNQQGTITGKKAKIAAMKARLWNTRGGYMGPDGSLCGLTGLNGLDEIQERPLTVNMDTPIPLEPTDESVDDNATPPVMRDERVNLPSGYEYHPRVFFRQPDPLPMTLLGFVFDFNVGGN